MSDSANNWDFHYASIAAIVLAAGQSSRMGRPKMTLPWGNTTVIGQVVSTLTKAGIKQIIVVTGGARLQVEAALQGLPVNMVFNPRYAEGEMILSMQAGLSSLPKTIQAALIVLGDQPQIKVDVVKAILTAYTEWKTPLVIPSYCKRRGHPWLIAHPLLDEIMTLEPTQTMRDFLNNQGSRIHYLPVETQSILRDLDTPEDYEREQP